MELCIDKNNNLIPFVSFPLLAVVVYFTDLIHSLSMSLTYLDTNNIVEKEEQQDRFNYFVLFLIIIIIGPPFYTRHMHWRLYYSRRIPFAQETTQSSRLTPTKFMDISMVIPRRRGGEYYYFMDTFKSLSSMVPQMGEHEFC